jgi:hypothetical protein
MQICHAPTQSAKPPLGAVYTYDFPYDFPYDYSYDLLTIRFPVRYESMPILN